VEQLLITHEGEKLIKDT